MPVFLSPPLQVTICQVSKLHLLCHQLHPHTGNTPPSLPWAAAHWPIKGARVHHPQPAWRLTCRVRRNASSCRTAGSWAAMWPWRAGEWTMVTYNRTERFRSRCHTWCIFTTLHAAFFIWKVREVEVGISVCCVSNFNAFFLVTCFMCPKSGDLSH